MKNYLPFIRRQRITIPAEASASAINTYFSSISELSTSGGLRTHLTDCYVYPDNSSRGDLTTMQMRMGVTGRSYLTTQFYPLYEFMDGTVKETGCWRFAKPYRVYPGDRLKARLTYTDQTAQQINHKIHPSIVFSGVRAFDSKPILLYQSADNFPSENAAYLFDEDTMRCPDDSPVDLYAVTTTLPGWMYNVNFQGVQGHNVGLMIWGPDGRQWWDDPTWENLLFLDSHVIDLRKPEWVLNPEETLVFEFRRTGVAASDEILWITVRGSYEVDV